SMSHSFIIPSPAPDRARLPSGAQFTVQSWSLASITRRHLPVSTSHTLMVSLDAESTHLPSGLQLKLNTASMWPLSTRRHLPVPTSHIRMVLSSDAESARFPSELQFTLHTRWV